MNAYFNIIFILLEKTTIESNEYDITNIYDEDEEMIPTINIENKEMSEDDIEPGSEYERMMTEFNESDEDEDEREGISEEDSDQISDEGVIIDQPLSSEQLPRSFGEFAPYFQNITESLFFCWMQKTSYM
ncbi:unnamed protein product [Rhizophagus irregularis]|nr:unnamed protein product [Rhizophagus irregularis]